MTFDQSSVADDFEPTNQCFDEAQREPKYDLKMSSSVVAQEESSVKKLRASPEEMEDSKEGLEVASEILQHLLDLVMPPSFVKEVVNPWMETMEEVLREYIPLEEPCEEWDGVCWVRVTEQARVWERRRKEQQETLDLGSEGGGGIDKSWSDKRHSFSASSKRARFSRPAAAPPPTKDSSTSSDSSDNDSPPTRRPQPSTTTMTTDTLRRLRASGINISRTPEAPARPQVDPRDSRQLPRGIKLPRGVSITPSVTVTPARETRKRPAEEDIEEEAARPKDTETKRKEVTRPKDTETKKNKPRLSPQKTKQTMSSSTQNNAPGTSKEVGKAPTSSGTTKPPVAKKIRLDSLPPATSMEGTLTTLVVLGVLLARKNVLDRARNTFNEDTGLDVGEEEDGTETADNSVHEQTISNAKETIENAKKTIENAKEMIANAEETIANVKKTMANDKDNSETGEKSKLRGDKDRKVVVDCADKVTDEKCEVTVSPSDYDQDGMDDDRMDDDSNKVSIENNNHVLDSNYVEKTVLELNKEKVKEDVLVPAAKEKKTISTADEETSSRTKRRRTWPETRSPVFGSLCRSRTAYLNRLTRVAYLHRQKRRRS